MGEYGVISYETRSFIVHNATSTEWEMSGSRVRESHKLFCSHYYCPVSPMAGLAYFIPGFHRRKKVKFPPLINSSKKPFPRAPFVSEVANGHEMCLIVLFSTYSYQTGGNGMVIFVWSKESSLSFGNAALSSFSILCLFLAAISWEQAW